MKATTAKLDDWVAKSACGRDLETQMRAIAATGQHGAPQTLRAMSLAANGFAKAPEQAELALIFGCYRPFSTPYILQEVAWLLERLGISHTWLAKENCCGLPLMHQAAAEDRAEMEAQVRQYVSANRENAAALGARRLGYCCAGCAHVAKAVMPDREEEHAYILDVLLDALEGQNLHLPPMRAAYFEGCHSSYRKPFPQASLNWKRYREFLDQVDGLTVQDMRGGMCCKKMAEKIVAAAVEQTADVLLCACSGCTAAIRAAAAGRLKVMSYPELLVRCCSAGPA